MKQKGFIVPIVPIILIIGALAVGGGVYYYKHKTTTSVEVNNTENMEVQNDTNTQEEQEVKVEKKKPEAVSFEVKARTAAQVGECGTYGKIGATIEMQQQYEYARFEINSGTENIGQCAVDMYQKTTVQALIPNCKDGQQNCFGTGLIPTPRKLYESIPVAPDPSTL